MVSSVLFGQPATSADSYKIGTSCQGHITRVVCTKHVATSILLLDEESKAQVATQLIKEFGELASYFSVCPSVYFSDAKQLDGGEALKPNPKNVENYQAQAHVFAEMLNEKWNALRAAVTSGKNAAVSHVDASSDINVVVNGVPLNKKADKYTPPWYVKWPQDVYLLYRKDATSHVRLNWGVKNIPVGDAELLMDNPCTGTVKRDRLHLSSGNIHVLEDIAFIGHNVLQEGYNYDAAVVRQHKSEVLKRLTALGLDTTHTLKEVEQKLLKSLGVKHIIWVGSPTKMVHAEYDREALNYRGSRNFPKQAWQPFYHIDLFFQPAKISTEKNARIFTYFIADAAKKWQLPEDLKDTAFVRKIEALNAMLLATEKHVNSQIKEQGMVPKAVRIPMFIKATSTGYFGKVYAFLNGLMETNRFFMPVYHASPNADHWASYKAAHKQALLKVKEVMGNENVVEVYSSTYSYQSALHCEVFVTQRAYPRN